MQSFTNIKGRIAPLPIINIDTDMIIPKQFLKTIKRTGLGKNLFDEMRFTQNGQEIPSFVLNKPAYRNAKVLVAGQNFGCGSSREHAPWAILDFGIRCIIAPSFADIFYNNCFKNGILPVVLSQTQVDEIAKFAEDENNEIEIDLPSQSIKTSGKVYNFEIDSFRKHCLINGLDDIGLTLEKGNFISDYEAKMTPQTPWLWSKAS
ncbi:MAG: 3-isopropylmalate dehydratase small subunit [Rickettsiales bacterium]|nr:3-isopropylmalate dehydratase small subunit [Rickettsiales bacterium]